MGMLSGSSFSAGKEGGPQFEAEVNKGSINMAVWQQHLNERFAQGYRLAFCFEQAGNTVMVFERRD